MLIRSTRSRLLAILFSITILVAQGCGNATSENTTPPPSGTPTTHPALMPPTLKPTASPSEPTADLPSDNSPVPLGADAIVRIDANRNQRPISPLIYGLSGATPEAFAELRPTLNSWGGNPSTRYNWQLGNAWNTARDWYYTNTSYDYDYEGLSASDQFIEESSANGAEVRIALPTLGWVAKDTESCSFPLPGGGCGDAAQAKCDSPTEIADPNQTSVRSDVETIRAWVEHLTITQGYKVRFFAMDNEPELWGITHYDVHPSCTTYEEILTRYLEYATMVREVAPQSELLGPTTCCWYFYWNSPAGEADKAVHGNQDFLPWFLQEVRLHDEQRGVRTLDVLDIHFYPEGVYNDQADPETAAHRLRSTRSLWDRSYTDESWIAEPIYLIPRMLELIDQYYPGTKLGLSEWNWGADQTTNGALAIADVLGILGREGVYLASYWRQPENGSPGFYAFKLYTNYEEGKRFGDTSVYAVADQPEQLGTYAALDSNSGALTLMLVNRDPQRALKTALDLQNFSAGDTAQLYRYSEANAGGIVQETVSLAEGIIDLPAYSITLLVIEPETRG